MSGTFQFSTPAFSVLSAEAVDAYHVRVTFTAEPADATTSKFVIAGHTISAVVTTTDPTVVLLTLGQPLRTDNYVVVVSGLHSQSGLAIVAPLLAPFQARVEGTALTDPARNDDAAATLKKHRTPALQGPNWDILTAVVAASEQKNWDLARSVEEQLFLATAVGKYLDRKAAHYGKERPDGVGMGDEDYRALVIAVTSGQVTPEAFLAVLEVYYGIDATHAHIVSSKAQPYRVESGSTLSFLFDGRKTLNVVFDNLDFDDPSSASALEVSAVLNRAFKKEGIGSVALPWWNQQTDSVSVVVYTGSAGLRGSVSVTAGTAQHWLNFPTLCSAAVSAGQEWRVSHVGLRTRFTAPIDSSWAKSVRKGDYVVVSDPAFSSENYGSFEVVELRWSAQEGTAWFEVESRTSIEENVLLTLDDGLEFFRSSVATLINTPRSAYLKQGLNVAEVVLPTTTSVVQRRPGAAAYLCRLPPLSLASGAYDTSLLSVTVQCSSPHELHVGDWVDVEGLLFDVSGSPGIAVNGCFAITAVSSPSGFSYQLDPLVASSLPPQTFPLIVENASMSPVRAAASLYPGAIVFDATNGCAITETTTTTRLTIDLGNAERILEVEDASEFPDQAGWLAFGFGFDYQTAPVPYLGRASSTQLLLDPTFIFASSVPAGTIVNLLTSPDAPTTGSAGFYLTGSAAGRVAAAHTIDDLAAAGIEVRKTVLYPGDHGLGNESQPTRGSQRLSDVVACFAGDDVDAEVEEARNS